MDADFLLAKQLQEQFDKEERNRQRKVSSEKAKTNSIVDTQWEIFDPNPDIYTLFKVFNSKFFWNELGSVEVKWSPRMYSCAGITTYKGRLGGCVVSLSLPLLKLRPRKDLVETLLHEMIHAYLFVSDRNSEREEHGPKFHLHMNRINQAAGTNITVYHSFHDEVKHYKTHWWRCNGLCRSKHPYYGLVKRSMNRAPGPNDFWFAEHQMTCGGEFIKVKEPDGFKSRKSKNAVANKENSESMDKKINEKQSNLDNYLSPQSICKTNNVMSFGSMNKNDSPNQRAIDKLGKTNNVHGFTMLSTPTGRVGGASLKSNRGGTMIEQPRPMSTKTSTSQSPLSRKIGSMLNNAGSSLKQQQQSSRPMPSTSSTQKLSTHKQTTFVPYSGQGGMLDPNCKPSDINRANSCLLKLFPPKSSSPSSSMPSPKTTNLIQQSTNPIKKVKFNDNIEVFKIKPHVSSSSLLVNCPVCNTELTQELVNEHLDVCVNLDAVVENIDETIILTDDVDNEDVKIDEAVPCEIVNCPNCDRICSLQNINNHLDECLQSA